MSLITGTTTWLIFGLIGPHRCSLLQESEEHESIRATGFSKVSHYRDAVMWVEADSSVLKLNNNNKAHKKASKFLPG